MTPRAVVYHRPRRRSRAPAVVVGLLGLSGLVTAQLATAGALTVPGLPGPTGRTDERAPVAVGPTVAAAPGAVPTARTPLAPAPTSAPTAAPTSAPTSMDLRPVPTTTVRFAAGSVLDEQARADLGPVLAVLAAPDAAPVLLTGTAEPGPDVASSLRLAQQRADVVAEALVEGGAPAALLRTTGVVDPDAGRSVVVAAEVP